jgi:hypothetical protein
MGDVVNGPLACRYNSEPSERLGTVEANNEKDAIEKTAKTFDMPPERQNRIVVEKVSPARKLCC